MTTAAVSAAARTGGRTRRFAKAGRDLMLRRSPGLQQVIRVLARRGNLPPRVWRRLHPFGVWTLHAPDGTAFQYNSAFPDDGLARHIVWTDLRHWECTTQPVLFDLARRAKVFVDVGAYSGVYTLLACAANPSLQAIACEPNPNKLPQLAANIAANGLQNRVTVVGKALSSASGRATLALPPSDDSQASLRSGRAGERVIDVVVVTGDELLAHLPVDLIKIDVEGAEPDVLAGMATVLAERRPTVIAECLDQAALQRLRTTATRFGLRHAYHLDEGGSVPVDDGFTHPYRSPNYLFSAEPIPDWHR
jgi:FkbM family methyltransferase